ncbi:chromate transporter-domain-containing protein [Kalaharituber pfeilii]|nr:chromate transporter-domain-containing protein [Kalaharituber pfeilii]
MPISHVIRAFRPEASATIDQPYKANTESLPTRILAVLVRTWDLGFTAFGGPPVHFRIFHQRFVEGISARSNTVVRHPPWIDEQTYQELFAVCQALPGPGSTKMGFCIAQVHAGLIPAIVEFLIWSGPGAVGMFALALGIKNVDEKLPTAVYALLSGLNSATVGIVALAAVQLAEKAITDKLSRLLVVLGACAGLCYTALWYFPVLILIGGIFTVAWDCWGRGVVGRYRERRKARKASKTASGAAAAEGQESANGAGIRLERIASASSAAGNANLQHRRANAADDDETRKDIERQEPSSATEAENVAQDVENSEQQEGWTRRGGTDMLAHAIPVKVGIAIIIGFFASFIGVLVARGLLDRPPLELDLFANMYLAGTIIFGGGPVVIPLLRSYVVDPGWVSPRDFLLGLALIQAFPGPNFNFAVFLGALALSSTSYASPTASSFLGAVLGFIGIFAPGMVLAVGVQSIWRVLRTKPLVMAGLRGVNATAVGLVFTAVYRLWEIGWLTEERSSGRSLGGDPWWVVVATSTFAGVRWFGIPPPVGIVLGGVAGIAWWGVVQA